MTCTILSPTISRDSHHRAEVFGYRLIAETDKLKSFPEIGRVVPEYGIPTIREIIVRSYRIVYRLNHELQRVEIVRLWHAARGTPEL